MCVNMCDYDNPIHTLLITWHVFHPADYTLQHLHLKILLAPLHCVCVCYAVYKETLSLSNHHPQSLD